MFDKKEFNKYFELIKETSEDVDDEYLNEKVKDHEKDLKEYFKLDDSLSI